MPSRQKQPGPMSDLPKILLARMIAETALTIAVLIAIYMLVPIDADANTIWSIAFAALLVAVIITVVALHQIRRIAHSNAPLATGVQALLLLLAVFILGFAFLYASISADNPNTFSEPIDRFDSLYFTVTILATVGFGDISAVSTGARMAVTLQMLVGLGFIAGLLRLVFGTAQRAHQRRHTEPPTNDPRHEPPMH